MFQTIRHGRATKAVAQGEGAMSTNYTCSHQELEIEGPDPEVGIFGLAVVCCATCGALEAAE